MTVTLILLLYVGEPMEFPNIPVQACLAIQRDWRFVDATGGRFSAMDKITGERRQISEVVCDASPKSAEIGPTS